MFIDLHCPAELRGYEITIDKKKNLTSCALTLFNLDDKEISSVEVQLKCFDSFGEPVGEPTSNELTYHLQDLNAKGKSFFGESNPIPLPDHPTTRTVSVTISRVKFVDGALWTKGDYNLIDVSTEKLSGKALEELRTLFGKDAICYARQTVDYWQCICGRANLLDNHNCIRCQRFRDELLESALNKDSVTMKLRSVAKQKEFESKKQAEIEETNRKISLRKSLRIWVPVTVLLVIVIALYSYIGTTRTANYLEDLKSNIVKVEDNGNRLSDHLVSLDELSNYRIWADELLNILNELELHIKEARRLKSSSEYTEIHAQYMEVMDDLDGMVTQMRIAASADSMFTADFNALEQAINYFISGYDKFFKVKAKVF